MLRPIKKSIAAQTAGSLTKFVDPKKLGVPFAEILAETKKIVAKELAEKSLRQ